MIKSECKVLTRFQVNTKIEFDKSLKDKTASLKLKLLRGWLKLIRKHIPTVT